MQNKVSEFYKANRDWIDQLSKSGNDVIKAMALAIIKNAEGEDKNGKTPKK